MNTETVQAVDPMLALLREMPESEMTSPMKALKKQLEKKSEMAVHGSDVADNAYNRKHFENGFTLLDIRFNTGNPVADREAAKSHAKQLREAQGKNAAYVGLMNGNFGVFVKDAEAKDSKSRSLENRAEIAIKYSDAENAKLIHDTLQSLFALVEAYEEGTANAV